MNLYSKPLLWKIYSELKFAVRHTNGIVQSIFLSEVISCHCISSFSCICNSLREIQVLTITAKLIEHIKKEYKTLILYTIFLSYSKQQLNPALFYLSKQTYQTEIRKQTIKIECLPLCWGLCHIILEIVQSVCCTVRPLAMVGNLVCSNLIFIYRS